jgi:uncharacterized protein YecT (DUF1311 family)
MKLLSSIILWLGLTGFAALFTSLAADEENAAIYESPKGSYRIQLVEGKDELFIVSTKNPAERAALPNSTADDPTENQVRFYSSPDEQWIFYTESWRHHGVRAQELYNHEGSVKFAPFRAKQWFAQTVQSYAIKNGGFKKADFLNEGRNENHLDTKFRGWSFDSSRLLLGIYGEADYREDKREPFYIYFNTRTKTLEQTSYLRELNKTVAKLAPNYPLDVVCAEPTNPLPPETKLKARLDALDEKLNKIYATRTAAMSKDEADQARANQQEWVKTRDEGVKTYLRLTPKGEEERRRLQFLADVTAARLEDLSQSGNGDL